MIDHDATIVTVPAPVMIPRPRSPLLPEHPRDRRPRALRWLLPTSCSSSVPLTGFEQARLKLIAYH